MRVALCMIVKDEEVRIEACLRDIVDAFDEVAIVDTGSSDRTVEILRQRFGIEPLRETLIESECWTKAPARNLAFSTVQSPWILTLDADERLSRQQLDAVLALPDAQPHAGFFFAWNTVLDGQRVEDYKLALFRRGVESQGRVHENLQPSVRQAGSSAQWCDLLEIAHFPDPAQVKRKRALYQRRLECALAKEPNWFRYHWFLGHLHYLRSDFNAATRCLSYAAAARSPDFPVECLNSMVLLAEIHARAGQRAELAVLLRDMQEFYRAQAEDFEVRVNTRLGPWIADAKEQLEHGRLDGIRAYAFPY